MLTLTWARIKSTGYTPDSVGALSSAPDHFSRLTIARQLKLATVGPLPLGSRADRSYPNLRLLHVKLASRSITTTLVGSYPTVSPLPQSLSATIEAVCFLLR